MRRDARAYLWDVQNAADAIAEFVKGISEESYTNDAMRKSAVERQLEIIGEALNQLSAVDAELAKQIPELRQAVGLRNVLIHGYAVIDDFLIWHTVCSDIPALRKHIANILEKLS